MCADSSVEFLAHALARGDGFTVPLEKVVFSGSHTHSGPGAWVSELGIQITPTMDMFVPSVQRLLAGHMAAAMVQAERSLRTARVGIGMGSIIGVTHNRRSNISPYVKDGTIDPHVGVIRVDDATTGAAIATLWNFAIHGVCWGADNMLFSSDIMGGTCSLIEQQVGGVALFVNGDAGDISPADGACDNKPNYNGAAKMAAVGTDVRSSLDAVASGTIRSSYVDVDFGMTQTNFTFARTMNCTTGGFFNICSICEIFHCDLNIQAGSFIVEEEPRFTAFEFVLGGNSTVMVTIPGEALVELGWQIRNDSLDLGFDQTFLLGYSNNYLMYFATPNEYDIGGYESVLTLWGINTSALVRNGCYQAMSKLATDLDVDFDDANTDSA